MKKLFLMTFALFCTSTLFAKSTQTSNEADVYVIIGQSNAAGWSGVRGESSKMVETFYGDNGLDTIQIFNPNNAKWVKHYYLNKSADVTGLCGRGGVGRDVGPYWAIEMANKTPDRPIYFLKHAAGGTSIGQGGGQWDVKNENKNKQSLWNYYENKCHKPGIAALKAAKIKPTVKAIFWMQGETNANGAPGVFPNNTMTVDQYASYLETLIAKLKKLEGVNSKTNIYLGTISILNTDGSPAGTKGKTPRYSMNVRKAQERIAKKHRQVKLIINDDAKINGTGNDGIHFNDDDYAAMAKKIMNTK